MNSGINKDDFHLKTKHINTLFEYAKNNKRKEFIDYISKLEPNDVDVNMRDENGNYLIFFAIITNNQIILKKLIEFGARLDIFDSEGYSILYYPIKLGYADIIDILLENNTQTIGISLLNIKDLNGSVPLFYAIKYKNKYALQELLSYGANANYKDDDNMNSLHKAVVKKDFSMVKTLIKYVKNLDSRTDKGSTALHFACSFQLYDIVKLLIEHGANQNIVELEFDYYPIFYAIAQNDVAISKLLIDYGANPNHQDYLGYTIIHHSILDNHIEILDYIINNYRIKNNEYDTYTEDINNKKDVERNHIDPNIVNLNGMSIVHLMLYNYKEDYDKYLIKLIPYTNLNYQDNSGNTVLHIMAQNNLWYKFEKILDVKKLNIFIRNNTGKSVIDMVQTRFLDKFLDIVVDSYYNYLKKHENTWLLEWQNQCSKKILNESKNFNEISDEYCIKLIREEITKNKLSIPTKKNKKTITITNGEIVNYGTFTGSLLDTIVGFKYLTKKYSNAISLLTTNQEITTELKNYYQSLGIQMNASQNIIQFEIKWIYQRIFMPPNFEKTIANIINNDKYKYIVIPISIILSTGNHTNGLIYDINKNILERFEPHGSDYPIKFNYNPDLLDDVLERKFSVTLSNIFRETFKVKYIKPNEYLPKIGFQTLDNMEININKNIGDPNGFCTLWTIWYFDFRLKYPDIEPKNLTKNLISQIRINNYSFRTVIRNYSKNITDLRDFYLDQINKNINDYLNNKFNTNDTISLLKIIINDNTKLTNQLVDSINNN
ncbi:ankyrin repeat-containing protein [Cotonvirus japonicus]|uniref:Ankyrin repeat-containing protein n=1 Tax=Cotonvirus japonicus TaxID=2811091 RepID=A0ABM7NSN8_9VIRU|nr:ankyrin repeat-containing protein [Cotonvirus japonicus]BCS83184.1 ankyrin repeat-containing protein [Cotonvirus japonicus]